MTPMLSNHCYRDNNDERRREGEVDVYWLSEMTPILSNHYYSDNNDERRREGEADDVYCLSEMTPMLSNHYYSDNNDSYTNDVSVNQSRRLLMNDNQC
jgi:hypothetical protein